MVNYALQWKNRVNLKDVSYEDFVSLSKYQKVFPVYFLQKIDGILASFVFQRGKKSFFTTLNNIVIEDLPVIDEYENFLSRKVEKVVLVGELVAIKGDILPFNQISSIVRTSRNPENKPLIYHFVFDVLSLEGKVVSKFSDALSFIRSSFLKGFERILVPKHSFGGLIEFTEFFKRNVGKPGVEGVVIRSDSGRNFKVKPTKSVDLVVLGAGNKYMSAWKKKQISYLITAFTDQTGIFRRSSNVGTGFTISEREQFFRYVMENKVNEADGEVFVKPRIVIEVEYDRFRVSKTPSYKYENGKLLYDGDRASVKIDFPSFKRIRTDKTPTAFDTRLTQIPSIRF